MVELSDRLAEAVRHFWRTRSRQGKTQGSKSGRKDYGNRAVATGGKQLDGFGNLVEKLLIESGIPRATLFRNRREDVSIPGFYRPTKQWDLIVVSGSNLLALVEFKSLCGPSFGNNYNNRIEEALGSATDLWTAFREKAFQSTPRHVLGYFLIVEEADGSTSPVRVLEKHFPVFDEFRNASYVQRCGESVRRLLLERCYDTAGLLVSNKSNGRRGGYSEPLDDLTFERFSQSLSNQVVAAYRSI